jgi:hypothetical protein
MMADTTQAWLDYYRGMGMRITPELEAYAKAYGQLGKAVPELKDPGSYLSGEQRNAYMAMAALFKDYGLESLTQDILMFVREGYDPATIELMLRETDAYKKRFAANEARKKAGLSTLSPAEYIATERQYAQVLRANGMPKGFYDSADDFTNWIAGDVSVNEVQERVARARQAAFEAPQETRDALAQYYGVGVDEIAAYFLDTKKAQPILDRQLRAAQVSGAAARAGFDVGRDRSERLADLGVDADQANQGYQRIGQLMPDATRLSDIYGSTEGRYDLRDAESEIFGDTSSAGASKKRRDLASRERAAFSGESGSAGADTLSRRRKGQV